VKSDDELAFYGRTYIDHFFCCSVRRSKFPDFTGTKSSSLMFCNIDCYRILTHYFISQIYTDSFTSPSHKFLDINIIFMKIQSLHEVEGFSTCDPGLEEILKNL